MTVSRGRKARAARRRKRRMGRVEHDLTGEQWAVLKDVWGACAYCGATGKPLQRDCVQALSRGGRYTLENIVPACSSCNASKCNSEVTRWLRRRRLDERAFLLRHLEIRTALALQFPTTDVNNRVLAGESLVITRDGAPVAELRPLPHPALDSATLLRRWRHLPTVDPAALRADIDAVLDQSL